MILFDDNDVGDDKDAIKIKCNWDQLITRI